MSKSRLLTYCLIFAALILLGVAFFFGSYHREQRIEWRGLQGKAARDSYYLTEQFLTQKGYTVTRHKNYARMMADDLQGIDTLLFTNDAHTLSDSQQQLVIDWVKNGGHVVMFAGRAGYNSDGDSRPQSEDDFEKSDNRASPLLEQLGVAVVNTYSSTCEDTEEDTDKADANAEADTTTPEVEKTLKQTSEDKIDELLAVDNDDWQSHFQLGGQTLQVQGIYFDWLYIKNADIKRVYGADGHCSGDIFAVFSLGGGTLTLYNTSVESFSTRGGRLGNRGTGLLNASNATLLDALLQTGGGKNLLWYEDTLYPNLWTFIKQYGAFVVAFSALLILAWIWRYSRRFGSLIVEDERKGLTLSRHLKSTGFFYYQSREQQWLLQQCYVTLNALIARRFPASAKLPRETLATQISEQTGLPADKILTVLDNSAIQSDNEFTQRIYFINEIQKRL